MPTPSMETDDRLPSKRALRELAGAEEDLNVDWTLLAGSGNDRMPVGDDSFDEELAHLLGDDTSRHVRRLLSGV